jgi:hypothetical protein
MDEFYVDIPTLNLFSGAVGRVAEDARAGEKHLQRYATTGATRRGCCSRCSRRIHTPGNSCGVRSVSPRTGAMPRPGRSGRRPPPTTAPMTRPGASSTPGCPARGSGWRSRCGRSGHRRASLLRMLTSRAGTSSSHRRRTAARCLSSPRWTSSARPPTSARHSSRSSATTLGSAGPRGPAATGRRTTAARRCGGSSRRRSRTWAATFGKVVADSEFAWRGNKADRYREYLVWLANALIRMREPCRILSQK